MHTMSRPTHCPLPNPRVALRFDLFLALCFALCFALNFALCLNLCLVFLLAMPHIMHFKISFFIALPFCFGAIISLQKTLSIALLLYYVFSDLVYSDDTFTCIYSGRMKDAKRTGDQSNCSEAWRSISAR
jgi:hypothetical protein